jgi:hypothetical protein
MAKSPAAPSAPAVIKSAAPLLSKKGKAQDVMHGARKAKVAVGAWGRRNLK